MTLAELALVLDAEPKWVLNTLTAVRRSTRYSMELARQLAIARAISSGTGIPITRAFALARRALHSYDGGPDPVSVVADHEAVTITIDIPRILSSLNVRLSVLRSAYAPRQRGRRAARRRDPLKAAADWGIDLSLLADNRRKTPEQRLRQLDAMVDFARRVHRVAE